jgi:hypothetical protein
MQEPQFDLDEGLVSLVMIFVRLADGSLDRSQIVELLTPQFGGLDLDGVPYQEFADVLSQTPVSEGLQALGLLYHLLTQSQMNSNQILSVLSESMVGTESLPEFAAAIERLEAPAAQ